MMEEVKEKDLSGVVQRGDVELIRLEIGKLEIQRGDVLVIRRSDGVHSTREEAARVRDSVLRAFEGAGWWPALLFVDGFELAVIRGQKTGDGGGGRGGEEVKRGRGEGAEVGNE